MSEISEIEKYQLTPKGFWRVETMPYMTEEQFLEAWARFERFMQIYDSSPKEAEQSNG